jgi:hypothetical protein
MRNGIRNLTLAAAMGVCVALPARADHDDWYAGEVDVRIEPGRGEGAVYAPGDHVRIEFRTDADAYHLVYAIDTEGFVRVLFPRFWEDDGWVPAGERVRLRAPELAWPADRWGGDGIVYVEAVASPTPFDWQALGVWADAGGTCHWSAGGAPLRVSGDPFLAFNDIHARIFPAWDDAVFAVDYSYFYVGARCPAPRYLGYVYEPVYVPSPRVSVHVRFGWGWDFGPRCARPVYRRYYTPGRHVVHHVVHHVEPRRAEPDRRVVVRESGRDRVERRRDASRQRQRFEAARPRVHRDGRGDERADRVERKEPRVRGEGQERSESVRTKTRARQVETTVATSEAKSGRSRSEASKRTKERR